MAGIAAHVSLSSLDMTTTFGRAAPD